MAAEIGEYKGNKMLILKKNDEDRFPFQFGLNKARLILEHIEDIKQFVKDNEKQNTLEG